MNRLLLYVHYNKNDELSEYVVYQLKSIRPLFSRVVFITNSCLSSINKLRLEGLYDDFIQRENIGFDFAAWRDGIEVIGWNEVVRFESLTIMNDTCFGPIYSIKNVYETMESTSTDFWGISDHASTQFGMPGTGGPVPHHIQSYFEVFSGNVIRSEAFHGFWNHVKDYRDVEKVIQEYETKLTDILAAAGFSYKVLFDTEEYSKKNRIGDIYNFSELQPIIILTSKIPLLKIKSFLHTPQRSIISSIKETDYPTGLIKEHLKTMHIASPSTVKFLVMRGMARRLRFLPGLGILRQIIRKNLRV